MRGDRSKRFSEAETGLMENQRVIVLVAQASEVTIPIGLFQGTVHFKCNRYVRINRW